MVIHEETAERIMENLPRISLVIIHEENARERQLYVDESKEEHDKGIK